MEDLQFAVEDVKLMNAMSEEPRPSKEWKFPAQEQVDQYVADEEALNPDAFSLVGICSRCLGFYMFLRHLRESEDTLFAEFILDVAIYKSIGSKHNRLQHAKLIHTSYLKEESSGRNVEIDKVPRSLSRIVPKTQNTDKFGAGVTADNWNQYLQVDPHLSTMKFQGEPFDIVVETMNKTTSKSSLPRDFFDELELVAFHCMSQKHADSFVKSAHYPKYLSFMTLSVTHITEKDFSKYRVLGRGGFGIVYGCKKTQTGHLYALKVMDRKRIKARRAADLCLTERNLMTMLDSPFIVGLKYAYETATELHLVLTIMTGGDLGYHLRRKGIFNKPETMYYLCRTILGLKTLHSYNIIFRDLKPDNILMDGRGRTALSDLGLAVVLPRNGITGACGTRGYWAPEMLKRAEDGSRQRYNLSVDWFSLGCLVYQFMSGVNPFRKLGDKVRHDAAARGREMSREEAIDKAVVKYEPPFPSELFTDKARDLIELLLKKDGKTRLGARGGAAEVMAHSFFSDINWDEYEDDSISPPCLPRKDLNYASQTEIGSFTAEEQTGEEILPADREIFNSWNYIRPSSFLEEVVGFMQQEETQGPIKILTDESICCAIS